MAAADTTSSTGMRDAGCIFSLAALSSGSTPHLALRPAYTVYIEGSEGHEQQDADVYVSPGVA
jgi:hypothetical protein